MILILKRSFLLFALGFKSAKNETSKYFADFITKNKLLKVNTGFCKG